MVLALFCSLVEGVRQSFAQQALGQPIRRQVKRTLSSKCHLNHPGWRRLSVFPPESGSGLNIRAIPGAPGSHCDLVEPGLRKNLAAT